MGAGIDRPGCGVEFFHKFPGLTTKFAFISEVLLKFIRVPIMFIFRHKREKKTKNNIK